MIDSVLSFLKRELNQYFIRKYDLKKDAETVAVSGLVNGEGKMNPKTEGKVVISLVNIIEEKLTQTNSPHYARAGGKAVARISPPVNINLNLLFAANFKEQNYEEALKFISGIIGYFQTNRIMTPNSFPGLDSTIERLSFEIVNYEADTLSNLWGMVGAKYMPSMIYRVRTLSIQEGLVKGDVTPISGFDPKI